jgi:hypothetical protein
MNMILPVFINCSANKTAHILGYIDFAVNKLSSICLLLRVVDPDYKTEVAEAFAAKQSRRSPSMAAGLFWELLYRVIAIRSAVLIVMN